MTAIRAITRIQDADDYEAESLSAGYAMLWDATASKWKPQALTAALVGALPSTDDLSAIASANATAGNVAMNSHKITGLANGSAATDSVTYGQTVAAKGLPVVSGGVIAYGNQSGNTAPSNGAVCVVPFIVASACTITSVFTSVSSAVASSLIRFGVYSDSGSIYPGNLLADFGTVDSSGTGTKTISGLSQALSPQTVYWAAYNAYGGASSPSFSGAPNVSVGLMHGRGVVVGGRRG